MKRLVIAVLLVGMGPTPTRAALPFFNSVSFYSSVSAYSDKTAVAGQKYFIAPEAGQSQTNSFEFAEFAGYVERALSQKGMVRVSSAETADVVVFLGYGIGEPKTERGISSTPTFGQTGVMSSSTTGHISGTGSFNATTINTPTYGVTGYSTSSYSVTTYDRRLRLAAVDAATLKDGSPRERWRVSVKSEGSSDDLRRVVPVMAFAASTYVGKDTGRQVEVKTKEKSKELKAFLALPVTG